MRIRNALANSSAGNPLNGYTFAIAGCSNVVLITHAGTFCLVLPPGPIIEDATCVPDPLPMTGAWGTAFAVFLLLGSGAALLMRRASPARL